jgi:hypothetical protein
MKVKINIPGASLIKHHKVNTCTELEVWLHAFLTSALDEASGQLHSPAALPVGKIPQYPLSRTLGCRQCRF